MTEAPRDSGWTRWWRRTAGRLYSLRPALRIDGKMIFSICHRRLALWSATVIVGILASLTSLNAQVESYEGGFDVFVKPQLPDCLRDHQGRPIRARLCVDVAFRYDGTVSRVRFGRVIMDGEASIADSCWVALEASARSALLQWKVKPRLWTAEDIPDSTLRERLNNSPRNRPEHGNQWHVIVMDFEYGYSDAVEVVVGLIRASR